LHGTPDDPAQAGWGGQFVRAWEQPHAVFDQLTSEADRIEQFDVLELALPVSEHPPERPEATMVIENQSSPGYADANGVMRFRFSPKDAKTYSYVIRSTVPSLDGKTARFTSFRPAPDAAQRPSSRLPNWWMVLAGPTPSLMVARPLLYTMSTFLDSDASFITSLPR